MGGPGTGKTTTLKYLVYSHAKEALNNLEIPLPIFLSLADLARSGKTLQRYLVDLVEDMSTDGTFAEVLWKGIKNGQAFVCLDSLDEVDPQQRPRIIELINTWSLSSGGTWVIGSRFTEYKGGQFKQGQFTEWELLPMSDSLRLELAQRLLPELQRLLSVSYTILPLDFVTVLGQHTYASAWAENPLLFSLAAVVFTQTGGLPSSRAMLYREVIEAVLKTREHDHVWYALIWRVLSELALRLYQTRGRTFSMNDLLSFLTDRQSKSLIEAAEIARRLIATGVMEVVARDTYGFRHQTFQEYLAAAELAYGLSHHNEERRKETWNLIWSKRTYSRWSEILRLMVGVLVQMPEALAKKEAILSNDRINGGFLTDKMAQNLPQSA
jgi:predicted NACHT family NTPase